METIEALKIALGLRLTSTTLIVRSDTQHRQNIEIKCMVLSETAYLILYIRDLYKIDLTVKVCGRMEKMGVSEQGHTKYGREWHFVRLADPGAIDTILKIIYPIGQIKQNDPRTDESISDDNP